MESDKWHYIYEEQKKDVKLIRHSLCMDIDLIKWMICNVTAVHNVMNMQ